jgi:hypothetical protein
MVTDRAKPRIERPRAGYTIKTDRSNGRGFVMLSAKGAPFNQAWGNAPGYVSTQTSALKARFSELFSSGPNMNRAFSAGLHAHEIAWGDASRLKLNCAFGAKEVGAIPSVPRTAPAFAPDQEERARRSEHHCPHIGVRGRDRPDGSPRPTRFRSRESETATATAMS